MLQNTQVLLSQHVFSSSNIPPQHICMKKKNNLYKQKISTDKASLYIKPLKHFIAHSGRASCLLLQPDLFDPQLLTLAKTQDGGRAGEGKRDPSEVLVQKGFRAGDDETAAVKVLPRCPRCDIPIAIHKMPTVRTRRYLTSRGVGRTSGTFALRSPAQGTRVLKPLHSDPLKIKGLASLLVLRLGQAKLIRKYQKASNMQIHTAKNQNIYPTPACWRI